MCFCSETRSVPSQRLTRYGSTPSHSNLEWWRLQKELDNGDADEASCKGASGSSGLNSAVPRYRAATKSRCRFQCRFSKCIAGNPLYLRVSLALNGVCTADGKSAVPNRINPLFSVALWCRFWCRFVLEFGAVLCDLVHCGKRGQLLDKNNLVPPCARWCRGVLEGLKMDSKSAEGNLVGVRPPLPAPSQIPISSVDSEFCGAR